MPPAFIDSRCACQWQGWKDTTAWMYCGGSKPGCVLLKQSMATSAAGILHKHWHCSRCGASGYCQLTHCHRPVMWPVLCKVRYELLWSLLSEKGVWQLVLSLGLNWLIGPLLMTGLAWATLPDLPGYRAGVIMVGLARCIATTARFRQFLSNSSCHFCFLVSLQHSY